MSIGYACLTVGVPGTDQKSCIMKNASEERLTELIAHNLNSLNNMIEYNSRNKIRLFRISSDLIPFGSSPVNVLPWQDMFMPQFRQIGEKIRKHGVRVSMHPGQYTVLNSPNPDVVTRSVEDLKYHCKVLDSLGAGPESKIVLHVGGIYNDKAQAVKTFIANYTQLEDGVKKRLVIENDDKLYNICDVLEIGSKLGIPVIFDNLHHRINCCDSTKTDYHWIAECRGTWTGMDGKQKIHYSQQEPSKKPGSHSEFIAIQEFMDFYLGLEDKDIDIMLEVKDKNLSAVKCIHCTETDQKIKRLEAEWSRYKYTVLERWPAGYQQIRTLLKDKEAYPAVEFYRLAERALQTEIVPGNVVNAALHVWGYFKEKASVKERQAFQKYVEGFLQGKVTVLVLKNYLKRMAERYSEKYLLDSYYFIL